MVYRSIDNYDYLYSRQKMFWITVFTMLFLCVIFTISSKTFSADPLTGEAFAEFDSSTGALRIFRDTEGTYTNEQISGTKTYYTELETITDRTNPKWYSNRANITSVEIEDEFAPLTAYNMFAQCTNLTNITGLSNLDTSQVTNMTSMFNNCSSLTSLDLSNFNTTKVEEMSDMFSNCSSLASLNISGFSTNDALDMESIFKDTTLLKVLYLGTDFKFAGNTMLTGNWRRDGDATIYTADNLMTNYNGSTMAGTYRRILDEEAYAEADSSTGVLKNSKDRAGTYKLAPTGEAYAEFDSSTGVLRIFRDTAGAYTDGQTSGTKTYYTGIESVSGTNNPKWYSNNANITSVVIEEEFIPLTAYYMFGGCTNLTNITGMSNLNTSQLTNMSYMFRGCSSLTSINLNDLNTSNATNMAGMFYECTNLTSLNLSNFDTGNLIDMTGMFFGCTGLTSLDLSSFNTSKVTTMLMLFFSCTSLTSLDLSGFDTSSVTSMAYMFAGCTSLTSLDLSNFDTTTKNTLTLSMFNQTGALCVLKLGPQFAFNASGMGPGLKGNWRRDGDTTVYTANGLVTNYDGSTMAGTYRRIPDGEAYAEFDSSTGVLRIFRDTAGTYTNGQTSGTKTYYTGIESITGNTNPRWYSNRTSITSVVIEDEFMPLTAYTMFYGCTNLTSITGLSNMDTSQVANMSYMFSNCSSLTNLNLSNFNTGNVTNMSYMFYSCSSLTSLNLSNFNTSNVTDMSSMFSRCSSLANLNLSNFNTGNVTNMSLMFYITSALKVLSLGSNFSFVGTDQGLIGKWIRDGDTTLYTADNLIANYDGSTMVGTYRRSEAYAEFDSSTGVLRIFRDDLGAYTDGQTSGTKTYYAGIESVTGSNNPKWYPNRTSITSVIIEDEFIPLTAFGMFAGCSNLMSITGISNLDTSQVTNMQNMFFNCSKLTSLDLSSLDAGQVINMSFMFNGCSSLTSLNLSNFNTANVTNMSSMFNGCSSLTSLNLSSFNTGNVTNMSSMFSSCSGLTSLNLSNFNTVNVTDMGYMFYICTGLTNLNLSSFNTSQVESMTNMFYNCSSLASLNLSSFNTSSVTNMTNMFYGCSGLTSLNLSNFNTGNVTSMVSMFSNCSNLTNLNISNFNTSQVNAIAYMFSGCSSLTSLNLSHFNTSQVINMRNMFNNCSNITDLDISSFDTRNVTNMRDIFGSMTKLTTLKLGTYWNFLSNNSLIKTWLRDGDTTAYTGAQLTNAYNGSTMSGTYRAVQALTITETVKGTLAEPSKEFDFTITVTKGGVAIDSTHAYTGTKSGNLVFNNGVATFTLKHADSITTYLPYEVSFTIDQDSDGYTLSRTNYTGILATDRTATFTDTLNGIVPTGISSNSYILYLVLFITSITALIIFPYLVYRKKKAK